MTGELDRTAGVGAVLVSSEDQQAVCVVSGLVEMLQVSLQQVGNSALPAQRDEEVNLTGRHLLAGILSSVEEPQQGPKHGGVHPGGGEPHYQLRGQGPGSQKQVFKVGTSRQ